MLLLVLILLVPVCVFGQCSSIGCCPGRDRNCVTNDGCLCDEACFEFRSCCEDYKSVCLIPTGDVEEIFVGTSASFSSRNYPYAYPYNYQQSWIFSTHRGLQLLLSFKRIETIRGNNFLTVGDGNITGQRQLLVWSGWSLYNELRVLSTEDSMWMTFSSSEPVKTWNNRLSPISPGLSGVVEAVNSSQRSLGCGEDFDCGNGVCLPMTAICNGETNCFNGADELYGETCHTETVFVGTAVNVSSPNYPEDYPNDYHQSWVFSTYEGLQLLLSFHEDFLTEEIYDFVIVGDGNIIGQQKLLMWSGDYHYLYNVRQVLSSSNSMWMTFYTDGYVTKEGFAGVVEAFNSSERSFNCSSADCQNGVCFPAYMVCEEREYRYRYADVEVYGDLCTLCGYLCYNDDVIPNSQVCDGYHDCFNGEDEFFCETNELITQIAEFTEITVILGTVADGFMDDDHAHFSYNPLVCVEENNMCCVEWEADWDNITHFTPVVYYPSKGEIINTLTMRDVFQLAGLAWNTPTWLEITGLLCVRFGPILHALASESSGENEQLVRFQCEAVFKSLQQGEKVSIEESCNQYFEATEIGSYFREPLSMVDTGNQYLNDFQTIENISPAALELLGWLGPSPFSGDWSGICSAVRLMMGMPIEDIINKLVDIMANLLANLLNFLGDKNVCDDENNLLFQLIDGLSNADLIPFCQVVASNPSKNELIIIAKNILNNIKAVATDPSVCIKALKALNQLDDSKTQTIYHIITGGDLAAPASRQTLCNQVSSVFSTNSTRFLIPYVIPVGRNLSLQYFGSTPGELLPEFYINDALVVLGAFVRSGTLAEGLAVFCAVFETALTKELSDNTGKIYSFCNSLRSANVATIEVECRDVTTLLLNSFPIDSQGYVRWSHHIRNNANRPKSLRYFSNIYHLVIGAEVGRHILNLSRISQENVCLAINRAFQSNRNLQTVIRTTLDVFLAEYLLVAHDICEDYDNVIGFILTWHKWLYSSDVTIHSRQRDFTKFITIHLGYESHQELCAAVAESIDPMTRLPRKASIAKFEQELLIFLTDEQRCVASVNAVLDLLEFGLYDKNINDEFSYITGYTSVRDLCSDISKFFRTKFCAVDPCDATPCLNGGTCSGGQGSQFVCICAQGFTGATCNDTVDPCDATPCLNGGTCSGGQGSQFVCICAQGFTGATCNDIVSVMEMTPSILTTIGEIHTIAGRCVVTRIDVTRIDGGWPRCPTNITHLPSLPGFNGDGSTITQLTTTILQPATTAMIDSNEIQGSTVTPLTTTLPQPATTTMVDANAIEGIVYQEAGCSSYDHPNYGCQGQCMPTASCPGSKYVPGLCPTQSDGVECCFTANTDVECATYDHETAGEVGHCISTCQCSDSHFVPGLCPSKGAGTQCCFKKPIGTCFESRQELACAIKNHHEQRRATLLDDNFYLNTLGKNDGASALDNIVDTCNGGKAKRSSYYCKGGKAPGGSVYLSSSVLQYILGLLDDGYNLKINTLAGGCHKKTSRHYHGTAVDLQIRYGDPYKDWMDRCRSLCAVENFGQRPGYYSIHTHCAFSS